MRWLRLALLTLALAAGALVLQVAGRGALAPPAFTDPASWGEWLAAREPVEAALALVRVAALAFLWYLAGAAVVGSLLRLVQAERLVAVTDRLTVPALRRLLVATATVSLASGVGSGILVGRGPVAAAVAAEVSTTSTTSTTSPTPDGRTDPTLTMRLLPVAPTPSASVPPVEGAAPVPSPSPTWTVVPGQCFWSIAEEVLAEAWGRAPFDAEIVPYWRALIEANRGALADPADEDLIFPAQQFTVPSPPPPG